MKSRSVPIASIAAVALACALVSGWPLGASDDAATALPKIEALLWEGWKAHDAAPFDKYLAEGMLNTGGAGLTVGKAKAIADIKSADCTVASFTLGEMTVHRFGDATAILTYQASQDATCRGEKVPAKVNVTSVWVKQGEQWLEASYHESPVPAAK